MKKIKFEDYSDKKYPKFTGILEFENGSLMYLKNAKLHREDGPALTRADGSEEWYYNGQLHRAAAPAITKIVNGEKVYSYYCHGATHRTDGPIFVDENGRPHWCLKGSWFDSEEEFKKELVKMVFE